MSWIQLRFKRSSRWTVLMGLCLLSIAGFYQNCSRVHFQQSESIQLDNNGSLYGGKPSIDLYRFIPDFTCEQKEAPVSAIQIRDSQILLTENKKLLCGAVKTPLDPNQIDTSVYQKDLIGYQEGIFESKESVSESIPANLVEVWCKDAGIVDPNKDPGIELITHFDRVNRLAVNRIYYSTKGSDGIFAAMQVADFPVSRTAAQNRVTLKGDKDFQLVVFRDRPSTQMGLFIGHLNAVIDGKNISQDTNCRLGGSLDPKVWPALQIVDFDAKMFQLSPDLNHFAFASNTAIGIANLYASNLDGTDQKQVSPNMRQAGISGNNASFIFTPDSQWLVYNGDPRLSGVMELFKTKIDGTITVPLRAGISNPSQNVLPNFKVTQSSVIFKDSESTMIKAIPLAGGSLMNLSPPIAARGNGTVQGAIATSEDKVVYVFGDHYHQPQIYSARIDGSAIQNVTPPFPTSDWEFDYNRDIKILPGNKYAVVRQIYKPYYNFKNYLVPLDGSSPIELAIGMEFSDSSPDGNSVLLSGGNNSWVNTPTQLWNARTGSLFSIPAIPNSSFDPDRKIMKGSLFFTQDSKALITSVLIDNENSMKAVSISTEDGRETDLCPGLKGNSILIKEESANQYLISSYDRESRVLTIFRVGAHSFCQKLNSTVVTKISANSIAEVSISPDQQKLLVRMASPVQGSSKSTGGDWILYTSFNQLIYIPLDGKPALLVDTPIFEGASITHASFLSDSRRILFRGNQISPTELNVFLWTAP